MGRPLKVGFSLAFVLVPLLLAGCGQGVQGTPAVPTPRSPAVTAEAPTSAGPQRLVAEGMVLDQGDGPTWCLSVVSTSFPPQCRGIPLRKWTWPADAEKGVGSTWATRTLMGTYDGTTFTVERVLTEAEAEAIRPEEEEPTFDTPCPEPAGGWSAPEPDRATPDTQEQAFETAEGLEDYASSWIDDRGDATQDPSAIVVNVRVTGDIAVAERKIRDVWGGSLCVSQAVHTEAELTTIMEKLSERSDMQFADAAEDRVDLTVTFDGGTLQKELDATYGEGLVKVSSILQPYRG